MNNILVIRNDKIGDFMLAWPAFAMLKRSMPAATITALVPSYTKALAELCPFIDHVVVDCGKNGEKSAKKRLIAQLQGEKFDASICLFSDSYNASLVWRAKIPYRLAPATKLCQFLYNHRVTQRRSQSAKPEYEYNLDLIRAFLAKQQCEIKEVTPPYLSFEVSKLAAQREKLRCELGLSAETKWVFVHAGSGGSANNLDMHQYAELAQAIAQDPRYEIVLTAGPGEEEAACALQQLLAAKGVSAKCYAKNTGLADFTCSIACAAIFIAGSTGPLHIAAALDVPTIGFFPAKRSATPLRWRPINSPLRHLAFAPPAHKDKAIASDMSKIDITAILPQIRAFIASFA